MLLKDRVAVVTGGGSGIGRSISSALADEGARVVIYDVDGMRAQEVLDFIYPDKAGGMAIQGSVTDEKQTEAMAQRVIGAYGRIDILVNSAGILGSRGLFEEIGFEDWEEVIRVNLTGVFVSCKAVLPYMKEKRYGKIIIIGSTAGERMGVLGGVAYASSKAGLNSLVRHLAFEAAPFGINANMVLPGPVATVMRHGVEEAAYARERQVPMGRLIEATEVADAVVFLASEKARMIAGVSLPVDGGILTGWFEPEVYFEKFLGRRLKD